MSNEGNAVEQAVVRALRDSLERMQRNSDELHHAVNDVVAACSSNKPTNALPPLLRAQTSAASLTAALEVLSRFIAVTLQPGARSPFEAEISRLTSPVAVEAPVAPPAPVRSVSAPPQPMAAAPSTAHRAPVERPAPIAQERAHAAESVQEEELQGSAEFDVNRLTPEEQELHRRANRVAKVSMQDIKMLHPDQVRQGRENKDICVRLKDDIEKAHREYDRRFKPIMDHPVDYFYRWMVEILAEGDATALGEYPYGVAARQHQ
jgi:outer membrane biosynthesis protein TonB